MRRTEDGGGGLLGLCAGYFFFYVVTGVSVKYFQGKAAEGFPGMLGVEFLLYSTLGGSAVCLAVVVARRWYRLSASEGSVALGPLTFPKEAIYIVPSGVCTAVVIPTTTLMYSLPISVMVAMVMMRGSVIVISRLVDAVQAHQGILKKKVYPIEEVAVLLALAGVAVEPVLGAKDGGFDFLRSPAAVLILGSYIVAYAIRIYIMNYYKNTRSAGTPQDNRGFFGIEQVAAAGVLVLAGAVGLALPAEAGPRADLTASFQAAVSDPHPLWPAAVLAGTAFGFAAFFSVFIFMFKGRTATFAGLVNRLTSLVAGTVATVSFALAFGGKYPRPHDWVSLAFILASVACLTVAERRRAVQGASVTTVAPQLDRSGAGAKRTTAG